MGKALLAAVWIVALTIVIVGLSPRARAEAPGCASDRRADAAAPALAKAREARADLAAGKLDDAFRLFKAAYCLYPDPNLNHFLSYTALALNRCDDAFGLARQWAAHASSDKQTAAQNWLKAVEGQCVAVAFRSAPFGATIHLDGAAADLGTTPRLIRVRAGKHAVSFSKAGYADARQPLDLPAGVRHAPVIVTAKLDALPGTLPAAAPAATDEAMDLPLDLPEPAPAVAAAPPPPAAVPEPSSGDDLPFDLPPEAPAAAKPPPAPAPAVAATPTPVPVPLAAVVLTPPPPAEGPARSLPPPWVRPVAWSAIGVGAALLVVATALAGVASSQATALKTRAQPGETIQARVAGINADAASADGLFAVGGVLAATGAAVRIAF